MKSDIDISKIRKLDGGLLLILQKLIQLQSVTKTADQLSLSQSTISHALTRLRELFDDPLFIRRPHGLEPTAMAYELEPKVELLLNQISQTLSLNEGFNPSMDSREFHISAPEFVTVVLAPLLLTHLQKEAPHVSVRFFHLTENEAFEKLRRGNLDVALGRFEEDQRSDISVELCYEDSYCVAANKAHPVLQKPLSLKQYKDSPHIWAYSESELSDTDTKFDYSDFQGSLVPSWLSALTIAANSNYVATCPRSLALSLQTLLGLGVRPLPPPNAEIQIRMAARMNQTNPAAAWLVEQIRLIAPSTESH